MTTHFRISYQTRQAEQMQLQTSVVEGESFEAVQADWLQQFGSIHALIEICPSTPDGTPLQLPQQTEEELVVMHSTGQEPSWNITNWLTYQAHCSLCGKIRPRVALYRYYQHHQGYFLVCFQCSPDRQ